MTAMLRTLGTDEQERQRRECERALIGRQVWLSGHKWFVRVVDQLEERADLVETCGPLLGREDLGPGRLKGVPLLDIAGLAGCSCGQHAVGGARV